MDNFKYNHFNNDKVKNAVEKALSLGEDGISFAAYYQGNPLVYAWGGVSNKETGAPVNEDTLFPIFSVTKGITATAVQLQADRGLLDLQAPIARYWPEYAQNGKEKTTVRDALSHRAGIPQMPQGVTPELLADWDWMIRQIETFTPIFEPGKYNAYHVLVWGWLAGEIVRRTDPKKRSFQQFVIEELFEPIGIKDLYIGIPDEAAPRVAKLSGGDAAFSVDTYHTMPDPVFPGSTVHNQLSMQKAVDPGAGGITTASDLAKFFGMLANGGSIDGVRILSEERVKKLPEPRDGAHDKEQVLPIPVWFGANGFWLGGEPNASDPIVGSSRNTIYSPGAGGSIAWADLDRKLSVAICHNNMDAASSAMPGPGHPFHEIGQVINELISEQ